jgi:hypothetical protein
MGIPSATGKLQVEGLEQVGAVGRDLLAEQHGVAREDARQRATSSAISGLRISTTAGSATSRGSPGP